MAKISRYTDRAFFIISLFFAISVIAVTGLIFYELIRGSSLSLRQFGLNFVFSGVWDPVFEKFGALPFIAGTLVTSFMALMVSTPLAVGTAIFLAEYSPEWFSKIITFLLELLAAIPSVVYGLWGIFVLVPVVRKVEIFLFNNFSFIPLFNAPPYGVGLLSAVLILSVMILPFSSAVSRDVIKLVPREQKEGAYALGATKWEVIRHTILPYAGSGIFTGVILALGRALGETMAVTMVIGNRSEIPRTLFDPANTMASVIANEFTEATYKLYLSSLIEIGLILFVITLLINVAGRLILSRLEFKRGRI